MSTFPELFEHREMGVRPQVLRKQIFCGLWYLGRSTLARRNISLTYGNKHLGSIQNVIYVLIADPHPLPLLHPPQNNYTRSCSALKFNNVCVVRSQYIYLTHVMQTRTPAYFRPSGPYTLTSRTSLCASPLRTRRATLDFSVSAHA